MAKHVADETLATIHAETVRGREVDEMYREYAATVIPARNGTHRAVDAFMEMAA